MFEVLQQRKWRQWERERESILQQVGVEVQKRQVELVEGDRHWEDLKELPKGLVQSQGQQRARVGVAEVGPMGMMPVGEEVRDKELLEVRSESQ